MYKLGMYGGSFNPLHLGHVNNIIEASNLCEKLYLVLSYSESRAEIDHHERLRWLKRITNDMPHVEVIEVEDFDDGKDSYNWEKGKDDILAQINGQLDVVFCGDDYQNTNRFENLYPNQKIHYFSRSLIDISSTEIRNNPFQYFEFLPNEVKPYYTKKIVIIGTESCGKSTLVRNLAKIYNTNFVPELGREICDASGGIDNMLPSDFVQILIRHKALELEAVKTANKVLFIDTEAMITLYYLRLLFEGTKADINPVLRLGSAISDLNQDYFYIFLEPDVKWIQDGTRTYGEDEIRIKNNKLLKAMLKEQGINYVTITGDYGERYQKVRTLINKLLGIKEKEQENV